ncbi:DUF4239 domain-containing protein [Flaviflagellibacter deserti]|uniref:DUF4239 domain-containing protein n=1 Tax=Flaviflagellibacter deserti TaxID=2267266 RepID=A0ABV9YXZ1_9HYPH
MIDWLHTLPILPGAALVAACFVIPTLVGTVLLQPTVARMVHQERNPNDSLGLLLSTFSLYYGVLLALLSIAVYGNYLDAEDVAGREAAGLFTLYRLVDGYPEPLRVEVTNLLRDYAREESGPGWASQNRGETSPASSAIVDRIGHALLRFSPDRDKGQDVLHAQVLTRFGDFVDARRTRIQAARTSIPTIMWYVVLIGAGLNILVLWLFDLKRLTHFIIGGVLSLFIGLVIYMVAVLDQPFRGAHSLQPEDLAYTLERMAPRQ